MSQEYASDYRHGSADGMGGVEGVDFIRKLPPRRIITDQEKHAGMQQIINNSKRHIIK